MIYVIVNDTNNLNIPYKAVKIISFYTYIYIPFLASSTT